MVIWLLLGELDGEEEYHVYRSSCMMGMNEEGFIGELVVER